MLTAMYPELAVTDVEKTAAFLKDALAFQRRFQHEEEGALHHAVVSNGDLTLFLHRRDGPSTGSRIYFFTNDVEQMHADLKIKGYEVSDLETGENGTVCNLAGPDGHEFWIQQFTS